MNNRTRLKILTVLHGIMQRAKRVWRLPRNPITDVEKPVQVRRVEIDVFSPEEVHAIVRAAASDQDAAIFLTAAFTGLRRGELVALRWRDVDFSRRLIRVTASYSERALSTPKSGRMRSVPLLPPVAEALARLAAERDDADADDALVFPGEAGGYLDGSALYRRFKAALKSAGLRSLRFNDLRHTFGTQVISNPAETRTCTPKQTRHAGDHADHQSAQGTATPAPSHALPRELQTPLAQRQVPAVESLHGRTLPYPSECDGGRGRPRGETADSSRRSGDPVAVQERQLLDHQGPARSGAVL
jgi:integrase